MKKAYIINIEEVTTCNGCPFSRWNDDSCDWYCQLTKTDITNQMFSNTKHQECSLIIA